MEEMEKKAQYTIIDNACYGVFDCGVMVFHGTMTDCIDYAKSAAEEDEGEIYRIGLAGYDPLSNTISLVVPVMAYTRDGDGIFVINELKAEV